MLESGIRRVLGLIVTLLIQVVWVAGLFAGPGVQSDQPAVEQRVGEIWGHVEIPDAGVTFDSVRAVLLPPEWALMWRGEVQQRLDDYSQAYKRAIAQDPALFTDISRAAHQEATSIVMGRMQNELGPDFGTWMREIQPDGSFRYSGVPFGDYTVVVVALRGSRGMIWTESFSVNDPGPKLLEVENRIQ